jgi:hypothetical protein
VFGLPSGNVFDTRIKRRQKISVDGDDYGDNDNNDDDDCDCDEDNRESYNTIPHSESLE